MQTANTGITSLQKLVDSAKSVANQDPTRAAFVGTSAPQRAAYTDTTLTAGAQLNSTVSDLAATATGNDPNEIRIDSDVTGLLAKIPKYLPAYQGFLRDLRSRSPGDRLAIDAISAHVSSGALYKALKEIRKLMKREDALLAA